MKDVQVPLSINLNTHHAGEVQHSFLFQFARRVVDID